MSTKKYFFRRFSLYLCQRKHKYAIVKMKKKVLVVLIGLGAIYGASQYARNESVSDLAFQNVEALAQGEGYGFPENFYCINAGDIDCYGDKVDFKYTGFSIDPERETE